MSLLERRHTYVFSSDVKSGARNVRDFGSTFNIIFDDALRIPSNAVDCSVEVLNSTIPWIIPNVSARLNNNIFRINYNATGYVDLVIPDGLYELKTLGVAIARLFSANGIPSTLITWIGDEATQKVIIQLSGGDADIDFTIANSPRELLGFNSQVIAAEDGKFYTADEIARFNITTGFKISSSLINHGIPTNGTNYIGVLTDVPIVVPPGSINIYSPQNPSTIDASELIGQSVSNMRFSLRNQNNDIVELLGETWQFTMQVKYMIPVALNKENLMASGSIGKF